MRSRKSSPLVFPACMDFPDILWTVRRGGMNFNKAYHLGKKIYKKCPLCGKIIKFFCKIVFQCDIPYAADIDSTVYFCHNAFGVVINPTAIIRGGIIQNGVLIGEIDGSHKSPVIEEHVFIGAKAIILGNITVGAGSKIGAGAVVIKDVAPNSTVIGVPGKIIK